MTPFEDLIKELGTRMNLPLQPDHYQSCVLEFAEGVKIQIDLDTNADFILVGSQLGSIPPGSYREQVFKQALRVNGLSTTQRGILAYSEQNDTLVLFQFLPIVHLTGEKLFHFVQLFLEHTKIWKEALEQGTIPELEEDVSPPGSGFYGLKP